MTPYSLLIKFGLCVAAIVGAYFFGRSDGAAIVRGGELRAVVAEQKLADRQQADIDQGATQHQEAQQTRQQGVREIYHETNTITERPIYLSHAVDADGVLQLDAATALANGESVAGVAGGAAQAAPGTAFGMDGRQCINSLLQLYDVAGGIRSDFKELQREVKQGATATPPPAGEK